MILALVWLWLQEGVAEAEPADEVRVSSIRNQIETVNRDLERLGHKLTQMRGDSGRISEEISKIELERALVSGRIQKHELELQQADHELERNLAERGQLEVLARQQQERIAHRLRGLYKRGTLGYAQLFLKESQRSDLISAYHYAKILTDRDQATLTAYRDTLDRLRIVAGNLTRIRSQAEQTRAELAEQESKLARLLAERTARMRQIRRETRRNRQLLEELELEKEELYLMIRRLTEEETDPMELRIPIGRYRGKLDWPHDGRIIRRFGVYRDPEFATRRKQNGIHLAISVGEQIRTVYAGRVVFADWFKNYGNLVVVDHNDKVLTFYAHCERILVAKGDFVERNQVIALAGDTGSLEGPRLHFEIRNRTIPENPATWLTGR